jgi:peptidoglycan/LPS O-acetylase OafA/YrhL
MKSQKPISVTALIISVFFQALSGLGGGVFLIADPTGETLNLPLSFLRNSPFPDYLIPGIILFTVLGVYPLIVTAGLWKRKYWGWLGSIFLGIALLIWIFVEIIMIGYQPEPPLQLIYGILGIVILFLALLPGPQKFFVETK